MGGRGVTRWALKRAMVNGINVYAVEAGFLEDAGEETPARQDNGVSPPTGEGGDEAGEGIPFGRKARLAKGSSERNSLFTLA